MTLDFAPVDDLFAAEHARGRSPGLVYAVVRDGELLHSGGLGTTTLGEETAPTPDSVQRIASMSKSFTASAVLLLRDRGRLRLDDPVSAYVPALAGFRRTPDAPEISVRHLLTMSAGLLTDDPWGDRNESMTPEELAAFLADGFSVGADPGTRFEYSNLGYALLGRVIDARVGDFRQFVLDELVGPLGMTATTYDVREVGPALVVGHHDSGAGWTVQPEMLPGTFSAMGGLHSSLRDLARWVGGFTDAFRRPDAPHPLSAASRREMQQLHRLAGIDGALAIDPPAGGASLAATATGYGFGLFVEHHSDHGGPGGLVQHSGGYPGYGSHMRWDPETGLGVVALANGTYAAPVDVSRDALRALLAGERTPALSPTATPALVEAVTAKVSSNDEPFTDGLFSFNVVLDVPEAERLAQVRAARDLVGEATGPASGVYAGGLGPAGWTVPAEHGRYDVEVKVAPTLEPGVQSLKVTAVPEAPEELATLAARVLTGDLSGLADLDTDAVRRALEVASALAAGTPAIVGVLGGDGRTTATFAVRAGTTWWRLEVTGRDPVTSLALAACPTAEHARLERRFGG